MHIKISRKYKPAHDACNTTSLQFITTHADMLAWVLDTSHLLILVNDADDVSNNDDLPWSMKINTHQCAG